MEGNLQVLANQFTMKKYKRYKTSELKDALMKASGTKGEVYINHLSLLVHV